MNLSISGGLMFLYYDGLEDAARFYEDVLGFDLKLDRDWVKIFKYGEDFARARGLWMRVWEVIG